MPRAPRKKRTSPKRVPGAASRRTTKDTPKIDMVVQSGLWKRHAGARSMARRAVAEAAEALSTPGTELAIVLTDDSAIRLLNREWRGVDAATNVLSFPTNGGGAGLSLIGDIVLSYETIADEARTERKPFIHHVAHLAVHGYLHLLGYDHILEKDAEIMERKERDILRRLAVPDPYRQSPKA